ncbi:MAG: helix-turn-helix transcriptional regulator [Bacteroidales bacterium]
MENREPIIPTYDPLFLEQRFQNDGAQSFREHIHAPHETFHINRIEDYMAHRETGPGWDNRPFRQTVSNFVFLTGGTSIRSRGLQRYEIQEDDFFFVPAFEIMSIEDRNPGVRGYFCHFEPSLLHPGRQNRDINVPYPFLRIAGHPLVRVAGESRDHALWLLNRLEMEYKRDRSCRKEIISAYLIALFEELLPLTSAEAQSPARAAHDLAARFHTALNLHILDKQRVGEYADLLRVSSETLNRSLKQTTGKSAGAWIQETLLLESKVLLVQSDLTVSEIADRLGQKQPSNFVRFFKSRTGFTPGEYRRMNVSSP